MRTRREFLRMCAAMAGAVSLEAQQQNNYRALVCVFQFGGHDGNNAIVPMENAAYAAYQQAVVDAVVTGATVSEKPEARNACIPASFAVQESPVTSPRSLMSHGRLDVPPSESM